MADTKNTAATNRTTRRKTEPKSYASVSFALHVDTEIVKSLVSRRLFTCSREAFTLSKNLQKYLTIPEDHMRSRAFAINTTLESVIGMAQTDLQNIDTHITNIIEVVRKERLEKTGKDNLLPLHYSNPSDMNIENRTYLGQVMCELIMLLDNIIKNLDFCRHYNLVPLVEISEAEFNAIKRMKSVFNTIVRHNNTMTRLIREYKERKFGDGPIVQNTVNGEAETSESAVLAQEEVDAKNAVNS